MRYSLALELEPQIKEAVLGFQNQLREDFKEASWLTAEQLFLTIKFLGFVPPKRRRQLKRETQGVAARVAPLELCFDSVGCFPDTDPVRTIWVGLSLSNRMLTRLQRDCDEHFSLFGVPRDEKEFVPHIPCGRVSDKSAKGNLRKRVHGIKFTPVTQVMDQLCLVQAELTNDGPRYEIIYRAPFSAKVLS